MPSKTLLSASLIFVLGASVTSAALLFGRAGSARTGSPPGATPPTFPTDVHPSSTMPSDTSAPPATESSNSKIAGQIRTAISDEPRLRKDNVNVEVTDESVMLSGHVSDNDNRYLALRIASASELMPNPNSGLIQIEYQTGQDCSLDFFKIWASTIRGHWNLICEFWMKPLWSHEVGLKFSEGYHSEELARTLKLVMGHEEAFSNLPGPSGLIQIFLPTREQHRQADSWTTVAFNHNPHAHAA